MKRLGGLIMLTAALGFGQSGTGELERLLEGVARYQYGESREPLTNFEEWLRSRYADKAVLMEVEKRLTAMLATTTNPATRDFVCRQLAVIGTDASVPVLGKLLAQPETTEMARYALDRIAGAAATNALLAAQATLKGNARLGVIHSLGGRAEPRVTQALRKLLSAREESVRAAAASALAQQGTPDSCAALRDAHQSAAKAWRERAGEALLDCAAGLRDAGERVQAGKYFALLVGEQEPLPVRKAALRALAGVEGAAGLPRLKPLLRDATHPLHSAAAEAVALIPGEEAAQALRDALSGAAEPAQQIIVSALGGRQGEQNVLTLMRAAREGAPRVRRSAIAALGELGTAQAVTLLAGIAAREEQFRQEARSALLNLNGRGVDDEIAAALKREGGDVRLELVRAAGGRSAAAAVPVLLEFARGSQQPLRGEAIKALRETAGGEDVQAIAKLLEQTQDAGERDALRDALATALARAPRGAVAEVRQAYENSARPEVKQAYLSALGTTGTDEALALLRRELSSEDAPTRRAVILALSEWHDGTPARELLEVARKETALALHVLAMRGFARLAALPSPRSEAESVALLAEAMKIARRAEEKKAILAVAPRYPTPEALALAASAMEDPAVAAEAKAAVERIERARRAPR